MKPYNEMNLVWASMYKPSAVDKPRYEVLKLEPSRYAVLLIRHDTGAGAVVTEFPTKRMTEIHCNYKNLHIAD